MNKRRGSLKFETLNCKKREGLNINLCCSRIKGRKMIGSYKFSAQSRNRIEGSESGLKSRREEGRNRKERRLSFRGTSRT